MATSLFVFGNGIGRAINNEFFDLKRALRAAWVGDILTEEQKVLIQSCLPQDRPIEEDDPAPTSEDELEDLQRVLNACETIRSFELRVDGNENGWLNPRGLEFPTAIRKFFQKTACNFFNRDPLDFDDWEPHLPQPFQESLREFIMQEGAHVATLNYDDLLYGCFTQTPVFSQYKLRDGFFGGEFCFERAEYWYSEAQNEGWFLHLHGSPLFITRAGRLPKLTRAQLADYEGHSSTHLVLTNAKFKVSAIAASPILTTYWRKLGEIIAQVENIVIVGYGGGDLHLNHVLSSAHDACRMRIVEYGDGQELEASRSDWRVRLRGRPFELLQTADVLEFRDWAV